jgi:hypothetical protein
MACRALSINAYRERKVVDDDAAVPIYRVPQRRRGRVLQRLGTSTISGTSYTGCSKCEIKRLESEGALARCQRGRGKPATSYIAL